MQVTHQSIPEASAANWKRAFHYQVLHTECAPNPALMECIGTSVYALQYGYFKLRVDDDSAYEICSIVEASDAIAMMSSGILTKDDALDYLCANGLEHVIEDKAGLIDEVRLRNVPARSYLDASIRHPYLDDDLMSDVAEAFALKPHNIQHGWEEFIDRLAAGRIRLEDAKTVSIPVLLNALDDEGLILRHLELMKGGACAYDAAGLRDMILKINPSSRTGTIGYGARPSKHQVFTLAAAYGSEFVLGLRHLSFAHLTWTLTKSGHDEASTRGVVVYADELKEQVGNALIAPYVAATLYEGGINIETAVQRLKSGMSAPQIVAVESGGIAVSVSDGWL